MRPAQPGGIMWCKFCGEIVSEGFGGHIVKEVEGVEGVEEVEEVE